MDKKVHITLNGFFLPLLFLTFLIFKLTHFIDWSWWWITAPLWGPVAIFLGLFFLLVFFITLVGICKGTAQFIRQQRNS